MRGGVFHEYLIDQLEAAFQSKGLRTRRQVPCRNGKSTTGYIDLLVHSKESDQVLLVEIELSRKRVLRDATKRRLMGDKALLWIVTPTAKLARSIRRRLYCLEIEDKKQIKVLVFGAAMKVDFE